MRGQRWEGGELRAIRRFFEAVVVPATIVSVFALAAPVLAAPDAPDPEQLIKMGNDLRRRGDDVRAHGYLRRAYDVVQTPRTAAQLGLVEQALGWFVDAEAHLSEALGSSADAWVEQNRAPLEESRAGVRARLGRIELVGGAENAIVQVATREAIKVERGRPIFALPGETAVRVDAPGIPRREVSVTVRAGVLVTIDLTRAPTTPQPPSTPGPHAGIEAKLPIPQGAAPASSSLITATASTPMAGPSRGEPLHRRWWFWVGVAGVVALAGTSIILLSDRMEHVCPEEASRCGSIP